MATAIIRPTSYINNSNSSYTINNIERMYDNDESTYGQGKSSTQGICILQGFNTSTLSAVFNSGGVLKSISLCMLATNGSSTSEPLIRMVHDAPNVTNYTDCGDDSVKVDVGGGTTPKWYTYNFPKATTYWNNNLNAFINNGLQVRLASIINVTKVYDVYVSIEYEVPMITVTTNASPTEGGTVTGAGTYESGSTVTCTATPSTGYKFSHWLVNGVNSGSSNPISGALTSDTTVTAVFEKIKYTVRWYNEDGTLLETDTTEYGVMPTYDGATPTKPSTAQYTYTFKGWHIEVSVVTGAIDYYARYTETTNKYTVVWKNDDGTVLETDITEYGKLPTYDSVAPSKPSTIQYTYTFLGWDTTIEEVTRDVIYTAVYSQITNRYTVEGLSNEGGYVIGGGSYEYGTPIVLTATPYNGYKFVSWSDGDINVHRMITVMDNASYTAIFEKIVTSKIYKGTNIVSIYRGTKKVSVYIGTTKLT